MQKSRDVLALAMEGLSLDHEPPDSSMRDVRSIAKLATSSLHIIANEDTLKGGTRTITVKEIKAISDQKSIKVFLGPDHSATRQIATLVLKQYGMEVADDNSTAPRGLHAVSAKWNWNEAVVALGEGKVDLAFYIGHVGSEAMLTVARDVRLKLLGLTPDFSLPNYPFFRLQALSKGAYGPNFPDNDIRLLSADEVLICNVNLPARTVFRIAQAIASHTHELKLFRAARGSQEDYGKSQLIENDFYPLHSGAIAYYKDKSVPLIPILDEVSLFLVSNKEIATALFGGLAGLVGYYRTSTRKQRLRELLESFETCQKTVVEKDLLVLELLRMQCQAIHLFTKGKITSDEYNCIQEYIRHHRLQIESDGGRPSQPAAALV